MAFELALDDPDGTHVFQARARDASGQVGPYLQEYEGRIIVDRNPPSIEERARLPIILAAD